MIEAQGIKKSFIDGNRKLEVLKGIDLRIKEGEFVAIIGRSGAGKSTLLYQLSLLDHPSEGSILLDGKETNILSSNQRVDFRLRHLGYVFQDYALLPELTASENVSLPMMMMNFDREEISKRTEQALQEVGLGHRMDNLPSQLSGGEQQRVSIARAFAHDPKIIFADEPTANLDANSAKQVMDVFLKLNQKGRTLIMVTHEMEYAEQTKRIIALKGGVIDTDTFLDNIPNGRKKQTISSSIKLKQKTSL